MNGDAFFITISSDKLWNIALIDPVAAPFRFGGSHYGDGIDSPLKQKIVLPAVPAGAGQNYLNVILDTATTPDSDRRFPSWGNCKVLKVIPNTAPDGLGIFQMPQS